MSTTRPRMEYCRYRNPIVVPADGIVVPNGVYVRRALAHIQQGNSVIPHLDHEFRRDCGRSREDVVTMTWGNI